MPSGPPPPTPASPWIRTAALVLVVLHGVGAAVVLAGILGLDSWVLFYVAALLPPLGVCFPATRRREDALSGLLMSILQALLGGAALASAWKLKRGGAEGMAWGLTAGLGQVCVVLIGLGTLVQFIILVRRDSVRRWSRPRKGPRTGE